MALYHHDSRRYEDAAAAAAMGARAKMEAIIAHGRTQAEGVLRQVFEDQPADSIAPAGRLDWRPTGEGVEVLIGDRPAQIHSHALGQMAQRAEIPAAYVSHLMGSEWGRDLLATNLRRGYQEGRHGARFLVREVRGEVRGFLSDRFRRIDSRPVFGAFVDAVKGIGAVPANGSALATKSEIKAILPVILEPLGPTEPMLLGLQLLNSDFGDGALTLRTFTYRLWCTNAATMEESLRQVHLGRRLDDGISYSDTTYRLDTEATVSALTDTVRGLLGPEGQAKIVATVKAAHEAGLDPRQARTMLKGLTKAETEAVIETFNAPDVTACPAGQTAWRLSNALSWVANGTEDRSRALEMERLAGDVLRGAPGAPAAAPAAN
jgi:hypothetical protein